MYEIWLYNDLTVWSLNAELAVFSGMQSTERRGGLQWKGNLLDFII